MKITLFILLFCCSVLLSAQTTTKETTTQVKTGSVTAVQTTSKAFSTDTASLSKELEEVVVTALGMKKEQRKLGYAVTEVGGGNFTKARETNVANSLTGRVAGLSVRGTSSGPGGSSNILLRGVPSISSSGSPLIVINGVPMDNTQRGSAGQWGGADLGDGLGNLNPDDIEKVTVLKGQSASALWGNRAANGVILITTKQGKKGGEWEVTYGFNYMAQMAMDLTNFQKVYGQGQKDTLGIEGVKPYNTSVALNTGRFAWGAKLDGSKAIGYDGQMYPYALAPKNYLSYYRTGYNFTNTLTVTKGVGNGSLRLSLSSLNSAAIVPNSGMDRFTANLNVDQNITDKFNISAMVNYIDQKVLLSPYLGDAPRNPSNFVFLSPNVDPRIFSPGYDASGTEIQFSDDNYVSNPYFVSNRVINDVGRKRMISALSAKYNILDNLYILGRMGYDISHDNLFSVEPTGLAYTAGKKGSLSGKTVSERSEFNLTAMVAGDFNISKSFTISPLVGAAFRRNDYEGISLTGSQFVLPRVYSPMNLVSYNRGYGFARSEVHSAFYSVDFSYKRLLTLTTTGRYDAYSSLPSNNRATFVPSVSLSFVFSELAHISWLSFGKIRASYAQNSGEAAPFGTKFYYNSVNALNGVPGLSFSETLPNSKLQPYRLQEMEVGLEAKFLKNRLSLDVAFFNRSTSNEIMGAQYSASTGFTGGVVASGSIENKGLELMLAATPIVANNFEWKTSINLTYLSNKVLKTDEAGNSLNLGTNRFFASGGASTAFVEGMSGPQIRVYDYKYDLSGNIVVDKGGLPVQGNLINAGSVIPNLYGGWNNEFSYKGLVVSFLIDYSFGNKVLSGTESESIFRGLNQMTLLGREFGIAMGVHEDGTQQTAPVAAAETYYRALARNISKTGVVDGGFIKLRQVSIAYSLPDKWFKKINFLKGIEVSLVARNLLILYRAAKNIDPESVFGSNISYAGIEGMNLPTTRSFGVNVNVKFGKK